jgi:hypothetical protein
MAVSEETVIFISFQAANYYKPEFGIRTDINHYK